MKTPIKVKLIKETLAMGEVRYRIVQISGAITIDAVKRHNITAGESLNTMEAEQISRFYPVIVVSA